MRYRYQVWHKDSPDVKLEHTFRARMSKTAYRRLIGTIRNIMKSKQCVLDDICYEMHVLKRAPDQWSLLARHLR